MPRKSWREKLADDKDLPKVFQLTGKAKVKWGAGTMVIPAPREVDAIMKEVPRGKLITINELRSALAKKHEATVGCPITTGIFAWIAAHAADEAKAEGKKKVTPYWRTLKKLLEAEGHRVVPKGKRWLVEGYEDKLVLDSE